MSENVNVDEKVELKDLKEDAENIHEDAENIHEDAKEIHEDAKELKDAAEELKKEAKDLKKEAESSKEEKEDFKSKFYYLAAEMENLRKRAERDKQDFIKYGNEKVLKGLIEVLDNFDRTVDALKNEEDEKIKNIVIGIDMVKSQFLQVLKDNGLELIECLGKQFDPNFHEALAQQEVEGKEEGEIIQEYQKGYILNGRLLRASKVIVVKK